MLSAITSLATHDLYANVERRVLSSIAFDDTGNLVAVPDEEFTFRPSKWQEYIEPRIGQFELATRYGLILGILSTSAAYLVAAFIAGKHIEDDEGKVGLSGEMIVDKQT